MKLAIDTSTRKAVLATYDGGRIIEHRFEPRATQRVIFAGLADVLDPDTMHELDGIVAGIGPGSFTGVKIGVIAAKTLAWSRDIPIVGVGSLDAVAAGINVEGDEEVSLVVAVPSTRGEAYVRVYENDSGKWLPRGRIHDVPLRMEFLKDVLPDGLILVSGEAAEQLADVIREAREIRLVEERWRYPPAKGLFDLALERFDGGDTDDPMMLAPEYIRQSQPERLEREKGEKD